MPTIKIKRGMAAVKHTATPDDQILESMRSRLKELRLKAPPRPKLDESCLDPRLPGNLADVTDNELGSLFGEFCAMVQYMHPQTAIASVELAVARRRDKLTRSMVHLQKTGTVPDKAAKVDVDPRVQKTGEELLIAEGRACLVESMLNSFITGKDTCSREISRRQAVYERKSI